MPVADVVVVVVMLRDDEEEEERERDTRRVVSSNVRLAKDWQDVTAHKATRERKGRWMQECRVVVRVVVDRTSHMLLQHCVPLCAFLLRVVAR